MLSRLIYNLVGSDYRDGILVGLGNPLLDFIATVDPKYLDKVKLQSFSY